MDRYGNLSTETAPRSIFVWENLLAKVHPKKIKAEARLIKRNRLRSALDLWVDVPEMRHAVHDLSWRLHANVDILCTRGSKFAELLEERLDETSYPYHRLIHCSSIAAFSSDLAHMPEVVQIFHGETDAPFLFGRRGRLVNHPTEVLL